MSTMTIIQDALRLADGVLVMSDHGELALISVEHADADTVTIRRRRLSSGSTLLELLELAQQQGASIGTATITVLPQRPKPAAPITPVAVPRHSGTHPCQYCGTPYSTYKNAWKTHEKACARRHQAEAQEPAQEPAPEPASEPAPAPVVEEADRTDPPAVAGECPVCGVAVADHPRCTSCTILIGKNHVEEELVVDGLCGDCAHRRAQRAARITIQKEAA